MKTKRKKNITASDESMVESIAVDLREVSTNNRWVCGLDK
jgi:hypothetical protein